MSALPLATNARDGLVAALGATMNNHPAISGKLAEVSASNYGVSEAQSERLPSLSARASHYTQDKRSALNNDDLSNPVTVRLRQPVWAFGRISDGIDAAEADVRSEQADLFRVRRELLKETALAYVQVLSARASVEVAGHNLNQLEQLQAQIERRTQGQLASNADARLAATRTAQSRILLERLLGELEINRSELQALTRESLPAEQAIPRLLTQLPPDAELRQAILNNSAALQLGVQRIAQARAEVDQTRSSAMPTVYLQAERFYDQPGLQDDNQVSLVLEASLDGLGFASRHRNSAAGARQVAAEQNLIVTRLELLRDYQRLQRSRQLQQDLLLVQGGAVADLESLLDSYQRQYESGSKSWLDVLNIQRELSEQQLSLVQAEYDWLSHSLQLQALSGGLDALVGLEAAP